MTNYYKELQIDETCSIDDLNDKLGELEAKWIRRETVNPDKAREMLTLISEAKKVFKDESSRENYDKSLASNADAQTNNTGSNNVDTAEINRWREKAEEYYQKKEFDLAAESIEEVFDRTKPSERGDDLYYLAAAIYQNINQFDTALKYINKAIAKRATAAYYNQKAGICYSKLRGADWRETEDVRSQMQYALEDALKMETSDSDKSTSYGLYAAMYLELNEKDKASEYAAKAVQFGDSYGYGSHVQKIVKQNEDIKTYSNLMPTGFVIFFIVEILTIILIPACGGFIGIFMLILSLGVTALLAFTAWAYPYGGGPMAWGIILCLVFDLVIAILFGNKYDVNEAIPVLIFILAIAIVVVFCILGRNKRYSIISLQNSK